MLEIVTAIHTALKHCLSVDGTENQSTVISSATHQVYQSLARFLELCDETLLYGEKSPSLEMKNVSEVITFFENSIKVSIIAIGFSHENLTVYLSIFLTIDINDTSYVTRKFLQSFCFRNAFIVYIFMRLKSQFKSCYC